MVRFRSLAPVLSSGRKQKVVVRRAGLGFPRNATEAAVLLGSGTEREYAIPSVYLKRMGKAIPSECFIRLAHPSFYSRPHIIPIILLVPPFLLRRSSR